MVDPKTVLMSMLDKEIFADAAGITDGPIEPRVLAKEKAASRRPDPSLGHPIAKKSLSLSEPNHAPIITYAIRVSDGTIGDG